MKKYLRCYRRKASRLHLEVSYASGKSLDLNVYFRPKPRGQSVGTSTSAILAIMGLVYGSIMISDIPCVVRRRIKYHENWNTQHEAIQKLKVENCSMCSFLRSSLPKLKASNLAKALLVDLYSSQILSLFKCTI